MEAKHTNVTFACNPIGNHWIVVRINVRGAIKVMDSSISFPSNGLTRKILDRALPLYVTLLSLRPGSTWHAAAFKDATVTWSTVAQQTNSWDCGPAALTNIMHVIKGERYEKRI